MVPGVNAVHAAFNGPHQPGEGELAPFPVAVFPDIDLRHHKGIGDFVAAHDAHQVYVI